MANEQNINKNSSESLVLANLYLTARCKVISMTKTEAAKWVGGRRRLESLVAEGKIRQSKPGNYQNSRWTCNAEDVLRHASMWNRRTV